ncbi:DUF6933 domain-containing protein [Frigoriglobus tundricola]|uniref:DUF6933 domain-containing protein n=1 Tax=Frigoriglobus tundricola TaxID=2774151 RepID=UPI0036F26A8A
MTALGHEPLTRTLMADDDGPVRFAKALNRSVSGSMNELVKCAGYYMSEGELPLPEVGDRLNDTLLSALAAGGSHGYGKPREVVPLLSRLHAHRKRPAARRHPSTTQQPRT